MTRVAVELIRKGALRVSQESRYKTRMEGARAAGGFIAGAAAGGVQGTGAAIMDADQPVRWGTLRPGVEVAALNGALIGGAQGAIAGFRGRVRENEGRYWAVDLVELSAAMPVLRNLSLSE